MLPDRRLDIESLAQFFASLARTLRHDALLHACLSLSLVGAPLYLRVAMLSEKHIAFSSVDARGVSLDVATGLFIVVLCTRVIIFSRAAAMLLVIAAVLLDCVSWEHVRVLNSLSSLHNANYLLDPVFLSGSVLHPVRSSLIAVVASLPGAWVCWSSPRPIVPRHGLFAVVCACSVVIAALVAFRPDSSQLSWRWENVIVQNVDDIIRRTIARKRGSHGALADAHHVFEADLSGRPRYAARKGKPTNVLIVLIEGLSGAYLPGAARYHGVTSTVRAPRLDALSRNALTYTNVFAQQRQTNRGEYSVLCGDYPKFKSETPRMTELALGQIDRACLPQILRDAGYVTSYLQAAPMPFMLKDKFMARAGFDEQHGTEFFQSAHKRNSWGVDDRSFFEWSLQHVRALQARGKPWFLSLLTVGTHHPFLVPKECEGPGSPYAQAVGCADLATSEFVEALRNEGILDNTLVLITADESDGLQEGDDLSQQLSQNWIPLLALLPRGEGAGQVDHSLVMQSDFALSILDYLGWADRGQHFVGRSFFRDYTQPRTAYFANTYLNRVWMLQPEFLRPRGFLTGCSGVLDDCASYVIDYERPFNVRRARTATLPQSIPVWQAVIEHSTDSSAEHARGVFGTRRLLLRDSVALDATSASQVVFGGQYLDIPAHSQVDISLDFSVKGAMGGQALLTFVLRDRHKTHWSPTIPRMAAGDRVRIRGSYALAEGAPALEATMLAQVVGAATLEAKFTTNTLSVASRPAIAKSALESSSVEIDRGALPASFTYRLGANSLFEHTSCLAEFESPARLEGRACREGGYLLYGPHVWVPAGSRLRSRIDVQVMRGVTNLHGELSANGGNVVLSRGDKLTVRAGDCVALESYYTADSDLTDVEARLRAEPISAVTDYLVREASLELVR